MGAPLTQALTASALLAKVVNQSEQDVLQVTHSNSGPAFHMTSAGLIDPSPYLRTAIVRISSAQILASLTVPVPLIPAPGTNLFICPFDFAAVYLAGTVPYTVHTPSAGFNVYWGPSQDNIATSIDTAGLIDQSVSSFEFATVIADNVSSFSGLINQPLILQSQDQLTLGNGTMIFTITYAIVPAA